MQNGLTKKKLIRRVNDLVNLKRLNGCIDNRELKETYKEDNMDGHTES